MAKILLIRSKPRTLCAGIDAYCRALYDMFREDTDIEILPIEDYEIIKSPLFNNFYKWNPLLKKIKDSGADTIHINGYTSFSTLQAFFAAIKYDKRIIYTAHWHPFGTLRRPFSGRMFFNILLKPLIKRYADTVITLNGEDTAFFQTFHKNVVRIPHWIRFKKSASCSHIERKKNMILFVGRINDPNKGIEHLYHLPAGEYEIHCVGKGELRKRQDIVQHVNIPVDKLQTLYAQASLLVVPSKYEAFSYVTLEALAFGTPVVLSDGVRIADYLHGVKGCNTFHYGNYSEFEKTVRNTIGAYPEKDKIMPMFDSESIRDIYRSIYGK